MCRTLNEMSFIHDSGPDVGLIAKLYSELRHTLKENADQVSKKSEEDERKNKNVREEQEDRKEEPEDHADSTKENHERADTETDERAGDGGVAVHRDE